MKKYSEFLFHLEVINILLSLFTLSPSIRIQFSLFHKGDDHSSSVLSDNTVEYMILSETVFLHEIKWDNKTIISEKFKK